MSGKILFVGEQSGNTASRAKGAEQAGYQVIWNPKLWDDIALWRRFPQYWVRNGPDIIIYNSRLVQLANISRPDMLWVEIPYFVFPATLNKIKELTGAILVCAYSDDPRDKNKKSRHFDGSINIYDVIFATKDELIQIFLNQGNNYPTKFWKGYDPDRIIPIDLTEEDQRRFSSNITFIGHPDFVNGFSIRAMLLQGISQEIPNVRVWGRYWDKFENTENTSYRIYPYQLEGLDYVKALCAAKIALQIPSRVARDTHSSRSLEIPACGTLMLAERTVDHQILFAEDVEAVFFSSIDEAVDKAKYYISHDRERQKIATKGYERCITSGYSNHERMKQMLELVEKVRRNSWIN